MHVTVPFRPGLGAGPKLHEVDRLGAFFDIIGQDPVLSQVSSSPSPGTSARRLSGGELSDRLGEGTIAIATRCAPTGKATAD
jgi:hypothetical protein